MRSSSATQYEEIIAYKDLSLPIDDHAADLISGMKVVEFLSGLKYIMGDFSILKINLD
jgi:hypothetical protein